MQESKNNNWLSGETMENEVILFQIIKKLKKEINNIGEDFDLDLLKGLKINITPNVLNLKIMLSNLEKKEEN